MSSSISPTPANGTVATSASACSDTEVTGVDGDSPLIRFVDADGTECEIECEVVAGTDGSRSICRFLIPENQRVHYFKEYPFAWFGVLSESPFNAPELIYAHSERGFALISQRTEKIQRLYFQCPVDEDVETWSNQQIWDELQARVDGDDGFELKQGPIFERTLLRFRSFVAEPMRWGRLVLAGDAAHTVPPTGAKGLNLAINDVRILHECLVNALGPGGSLDALDAYGPRALDRIWKSENFSYWMTQMLHTPVEGVSFDLKRQIGELNAVVSSTGRSDLPRRVLHRLAGPKARERLIGVSALGRPVGRREEVCDNRFPDRVAPGLLLESAIGAGQPVLALSDILGPSADQEGLDESGGFAAVAEQFPAKGSGASAGAPDVAHRFGERGRVVLGDLIGQGHHDRAVGRIRGEHQLGGGPVRRRPPVQVGGIGHGTAQPD